MNARELSILKGLKNAADACMDDLKLRGSLRPYTAAQYRIVRRMAEDLIVADTPCADDRQRRAAEFAQDFERPPGIDPASRDNAPPIAPDLPTHWEACSRSDLEYLADFGTYGQRLIARRCLIDLPNSKGEA